MSGLSSSRRRGFRLGWWGAAVTHVGSDMVRRSRTFNAAAAGARAVWRSLSRIGGLLWLEVTGLFFVFFAAIGGLAAWHEYSRHKIISGRLVAAVCFSVVFGWFGLSSFWRVRRKR
jgi:hypothetical protein